MSTECTIVIEKDEDGYYVGSVPERIGPQSWKDSPPIKQGQARLTASGRRAIL